MVRASTAREIAFQIAPRINAAGRMAHAGDVIQLFLTSDLEQARQLAQQLHVLNQERQQTEAEVIRTILDECTRSPVTDQDFALVFSSPGWHRGVVGIVASRLVDRFSAPSLYSVKRMSPPAVGRSIPAFHLLDALDSMKDLFTSFGGHRQAAGVGLDATQVAEFRHRFNAYAAERLTPADFKPQLAIDALVRFDELDDESVQELLSLAPFGFGNPAPVLVAFAAEIIGDPVRFKDKHLRIRLRQTGRILQSTAWNFVERAGECCPGHPIDVAFCLEEDDYGRSRGWSPWRAILRDLRTAQSRPVAAGSASNA